MRVISQNGRIDIPYDYFSLSMSWEKIASGKVEDRNVFSIVCHNLSSPNGTKLAEYSTEEKVKKAMKMLRIAYENNEFYHHTANSEHFTEFSQALSKEMFKKATSEYFQFPTEEELE
jgi:hypothetical protein